MLQIISNIKISTMTQFYNRYRNLFTNKPSNHQPRQDFLQKKHIFINQPQLPYQLDHYYTADYKKKPIQKSPAIAEFERVVLPKLSNDYHQSQFYKLTQEMQQKAIKIKQFANAYQKPILQTYQSPKRIEFNNKSEQKKRVHTEPTTVNYKDTLSNRDVHNLNKHMAELEKLYMGDNSTKYKIEHNKKQQIQNPNKVNINYNDRSNVTLKENSKFEQLYKNQYAKKWNIKILPVQSKPLPRHSPSPTKSHIEVKEYQAYQRQLYGLKQNPYAFVNSKMDQIRRSEKYYPRGYINNYRDSIYRRRKSKNNIEQRRNKLKQLLAAQINKYGYS